MVPHRVRATLRGTENASLAPGLLTSRVITMHDVRGAPIPGVPPSVQRSGGAGSSFGRVLRQVTARPAGSPRSLPRASAPEWRAPVFRPRILTVPRHVVRSAPTSIARTGARAPGDRQRLIGQIHRAADAVGVDRALSVAVARAESSLDPRARSSDGLSVGTFQVTYYTEAEMHRKIARGDVERPPGPDDVALGVGYLRYLHDLFGRRARLARGLDTVPIADPAERRPFVVAAFNAGEGRVARAQARVAATGGDPTRFAEVEPLLPRITRRYVGRVLDDAGAGSAT